MEGLLVLPKDLRAVAVGDLPDSVRAALDASSDSYAIARPNSRVPSRVIDGAVWSLLQQFREPTTLVDAIIRHSRTVCETPSDVFEQAYAVLENLYQDKLLVETDSADVAAILPSHKAGGQIGEYLIVRNVQILPDTELYEVRTATGDPAALKALRHGAAGHIAAALEREKQMLLQLRDYCSAPALLDSGMADGQPYLVMEWRAGIDPVSAATRLRASDPEALTALCERIVDAYVELHRLGVCHGDVHPRNMLVTDNGDLSIIDFGLATHVLLGPGPRGGQPMFLEPEYASAELAGMSPPPVSVLGEQYAVAALLYMVICGARYLDFAVDRQEMLRQLVEIDPVPFGIRRCAGYAETERVLRRALSKDPAQRWPDMAAFARALRQAASHDAEAATRAATTSPPSMKEFVDSILARTAVPSRDLEMRGLRAPVASVMYGAAGVACGLLRIAAIRDDGELLARADAWAEFATSLAGAPDAFYENSIQLTAQIIGTRSPYFCEPGIHVVRALIAHRRGDMATREALIERFLSGTNESSAEIDLTLGDGSILMALSLLRECSGPSSALDDCGNSTLARIWEKLALRPPIRDDKPSQALGIAHGWGGYLYCSLRWAEAAGISPPPQIRARLEELIEVSMARPKGIGWPWRLGSSGEVLSGWCNGSAGFTFLWTLAHDVYRESRFLELAELTAIGMLQQSSDPGTLCCGAAGQAYALLTLYRHTNSSRWIEAAKTITYDAVTSARKAEVRGDPALPLSLYKGDLGLAVLIEDLRCPALACMPFFEAEKWPTTT